MPAYIWYPVFAGLTFGFSFMSIPPVSTQFMALFGVQYGGLSLLLSGIQWSHALIQIPAGLLVDRIGVYRGVILFGSLGVAANLAPFLATDNLALAVACRFALGMSTGVMFLCILKIIGVLSPPSQMAKAQGFYGGAFGFGTMLPYFILPHLGDWAWAWSYLVCAAMYLAAMLFLFFLPLGKIREGSAAVGGAVSLWHNLKTILPCPEIWILGLFHGICYGTLNNLGQWLPFILSDLSERPVAAWSLATTLVLFLGSCSRSLSGHALRLVSRPTAVNGALLLAFLLYTGMAFGAGPYVTLAFGLLLVLAVGFTYGSLFTMASRVLPPVFMGTALGLMNSVANLCNVGLTLLFGNVREHTGSFGWALFTVGVVALVAWLAFRRTILRIDRTVE